MPQKSVQSLAPFFPTVWRVLHRTRVGSWNTLQGTNISHLDMKENHLQKCLGRGYVGSQVGICWIKKQIAETLEFKRVWSFVALHDLTHWIYRNKEWPYQRLHKYAVQGYSRSSRGVESHQTKNHQVVSHFFPWDSAKHVPLLPSPPSSSSSSSPPSPAWLSSPFLNVWPHPSLPQLKGINVLPMEGHHIPKVGVPIAILAIHHWNFSKNAGCFIGFHQ